MQPDIAKRSAPEPYATSKRGKRRSSRMPCVKQMAIRPKPRRLWEFQHARYIGKLRNLRFFNHDIKVRNYLCAPIRTETPAKYFGRLHLAAIFCCDDRSTAIWFPSVCQYNPPDTPIHGAR